MKRNKNKQSGEKIINLKNIKSKNIVIKVK